MKKRILVIDDLEYSQMFEKHVINVLMDDLDLDIINDKAYTVNQALDMIQHNETYDAVICDMNLPDGTGSVITKAAKFKNADTGTAAFTIYPNIIYEKERAYCDLFLCKLRMFDSHKNSIASLLQQKEY
jgi:CheY-like chemotaxis protein